MKATLAAFKNYFVAQEAKAANLIQIEKDLIEAKEIIYRLINEIDALNKSIQEKTDALSNATVAANDINTSLYKFIGRKEISLKPSEGGYQLIRHGGQKATNLSEGKKTAIALIYFLVRRKNQK